MPSPGKLAELGICAAPAAVALSVVLWAYGLRRTDLQATVLCALALTAAHVAYLGVPPLLPRRVRRAGSQATLGAAMTLWTLAVCVALAVIGDYAHSPPVLVEVAIPDPDIGECVRVSAGATSCNPDADVFVHGRSLAMLNISWDLLFLALSLGSLSSRCF